MNDKPTMVCGLDVFHQTSMGKKSVLGFCASVDKTSTKFFSKSLVQEVGQEIGQEFEGIVKQACLKFKDVNGTLPGRVIVYRDGVSDSQISAVCAYEIQQLKNGLKSAGCDSELIYLNVNKRVNTRLFGGDIGNFKNPVPGTVVDKGITDNDFYEFYLISVAAKQGLNAPCKFTVVEDTSGASPDQIELLTYKLCHNYYNVSGAIKEPACIRYAHRLAALVGERGTKKIDPPKVHEHFSESLTSLYFI